MNVTDNKFNCKWIEKQQLLNYTGKFKWFLGFYADDAVLRQLDEEERLDELTESLVEGYFFNKEAELHYFHYDNEVKINLLSDAEGESEMDFNIVYRKIMNSERYKKAGNYLKIKEYLGYDEDGQLYVKASRLVDIADSVEV